MARKNIPFVALKLLYLTCVRAGGEKLQHKTYLEKEKRQRPIVREKRGEKHQVDHKYQHPVPALRTQKGVYFGHRNVNGYIPTPVFNVLLQTDIWDT